MKNIITTFIMLVWMEASLAGAKILIQDLIPIQFKGINSMYTLNIQLGSTYVDPTLQMLVDTGSIWSWILSCDTRYNEYWELNKCPNYFFDASDSKTIECNKDEYTIDFNNIDIKGHLCTDELKLADGGLNMTLQFLSKVAPKIEDQYYYEGALGFSPMNLSSNSILLAGLYKQGDIGKDQLALLFSPYYDSPRVTIELGGYQTSTNVTTNYDPSLNDIICHPLTGTFNWEISLMNAGFGQKDSHLQYSFKESDPYSFVPSARRLALNTGSRIIMMPDKDFH